MGAEKQRPLLQAADLRFRRRLIGVAAALGVCALALVIAGIWDWLPIKGAGLEIYKLSLQFFLITAGGGVLLALVGNARDVASWRQERAASIQALDRELDAAYRALKKVKRRLRAHSRYAVDDGNASAASAGAVAEHRIPRAVFEKAMDDLLDAQLELETICDHIGQRDDILHRDRLKRMKGPLRYASRYYHDVHEDFEKGRVRLERDQCYALGGAFNLNDYLRSVKDVRGERTDAFRAALKTLKNEQEDLPERAKALDKLVAASPDAPLSGDSEEEPDKMRFADVAGACFDLLSAELAQVRTKLLS